MSKHFRKTVYSNNEKTKETSDEAFMRMGREIEERLSKGEILQNLTQDELNILERYKELKAKLEKTLNQQDEFRTIATEQVKFLLNQAQFSKSTDIIEELVKALNTTIVKQNINVIPYGEREYIIPKIIQGYIRSDSNGIYPFEQLGKLITDDNTNYNYEKENNFINEIFSTVGNYTQHIKNIDDIFTHNTRKGIGLIRNLIARNTDNEELYTIKLNLVDDIINKLRIYNHQPFNFRTTFKVEKDKYNANNLLNSIPLNDFNSYWMGSIDNLLSDINANYFVQDEYNNYLNELENLNIYKTNKTILDELHKIWNNKENQKHEMTILASDKDLRTFLTNAENLFNDIYGKGGFGVFPNIDDDSITSEKKSERDKYYKNYSDIDKTFNKKYDTYNVLTEKRNVLQEQGTDFSLDDMEKYLLLEKELQRLEAERDENKVLYDSLNKPFVEYDDTINKVGRVAAVMLDYLKKNENTKSLNILEFINDLYRSGKYNILKNDYKNTTENDIMNIYISRILPQFFTFDEHIRRSNYPLMESSDITEWNNISREFKPIIKFSKRNFLPLSLLNYPIETFNFILDNFDSNQVGDLLRVIKSTNPTYLKNTKNLIEKYFINDLKKYERDLVNMSINDFNYRDILKDSGDEKLFILLKNLNQNITNDELQHYGSTLNQDITKHTNELVNSLNKFKESKRRIENLLANADEKIINNYNEFVNASLNKTEEQFEKNKEDYINIIRDNSELYNAVNNSIESQNELIEKMKEYKTFVSSNPTLKNNSEIESIINSVESIIDSQSFVKNFANQNMRQFFRDSIRGWSILGENNPFFSEFLNEEQRREYELAQSEIEVEDRKQMAEQIKKIFETEGSISLQVLLAEAQEKLAEAQKNNIEQRTKYLDEQAKYKEEIQKFTHLKSQFEEEQKILQLEKERYNEKVRTLNVEKELLNRRLTEQEEISKRKIEDLKAENRKITEETEEKLKRLENTKDEEYKVLKERAEKFLKHLRKQKETIKEMEQKQEEYKKEIETIKKEKENLDIDTQKKIARLTEEKESRINLLVEELEQKEETHYKELESMKKLKETEQLNKINQLIDEVETHKNKVKDIENFYKTENKKLVDDMLKERIAEYEKIDKNLKSYYQQKEDEMKKDYETRLENLNKEIKDLKERNTNLTSQNLFSISKDSVNNTKFNATVKEEVERLLPEEIRNTKEKIKELEDERNNIIIEREVLSRRISELENQEKVINRVVSIEDIRNMLDNATKRPKEDSELIKQIAEVLLKKRDENIEKIKENPNLTEKDIEKITNIIDSNVSKFVGNEEVIKNLSEGTIESVSKITRDLLEENKKDNMEREKFTKGLTERIVNINSKLINNLENLHLNLNQTASNIKNHTFRTIDTFFKENNNKIDDLHKLINDFIPVNGRQYKENKEKTEKLEKDIQNINNTIKDINEKGVKSNIDEQTKYFEDYRKKINNDMKNILNEINQTKMDKQVLESRKEKWYNIFDSKNSDILKQKLNQIYTESKMPEENEESYFKKRFSQAKLKETFGLDNNYPDIGYSDVKNYLPEQFFRDMMDYIEGNNKNKPVVKLYTTNYEPTAKSSGFSDNTKRRLLKLYYYFKDPKMRTSKKNELPRNFLHDLSMLSNFSEKDVEKKYAQFLRTGFF